MSAAHNAGIVSIGYQGRSVQELVEECVTAGVTVVADVGLTPLSRKPGLSKSKLGATLETAGIGYVHLPSLGNPRDNRESFGSATDRERGRSRFRSLLHLDGPAKALSYLAELAQTERVALLCFERDALQCHRQVLTEELSARDPPWQSRCTPSVCLVISR